MKKLLAAILALSVLLTGCNSFPSPDTYSDLGNTFHKETDYPYQFINCFSFFSITPGESGYYFFYGNTLCFFDKEMKKAIPVCNKPECVHQDESCPAFFLRDGRGLLQWYNGKLYVETFRPAGFMTEEVFLYEVDLSAGTRQKICQLPYTYGSMTYYMMHRGYLYIVHNAIERDKGTNEDRQVYRIERIALNKLSDEQFDSEILFEEAGRIVLPSGFPLLYGDHLVFGVTKEEGSTIEIRTYDYRIDEQSLNEIIFPNIEDGAYILFDSIKDGKLIATYVSPETARWESFETSYYEYDIENGTFTPIITFPDRGEEMSEFLIWDGANWITAYLDTLGMPEDFSPNQEIRMLNEDLRQIAVLPLDFYELSFVTGDEDFAFYGSAFEYELYAIDKRNGKLELIEILKAS